MKPRKTKSAAPDPAAQLRLITDALPLQIAHFDRELRYQFVNRAYAVRYRLEPSELIGRTLAAVVGDSAARAARAPIDAVLAGEQQEFETETDAPPPHPGKTWHHVTYTPERAPDGGVIGFIAAFLDITARKHTEREITQVRDQALAGGRAKDEFLAAISHALRTPLNPVLLLASEAAANPELPAAVRADFDTIRQNVDLEAHLIDDLVDLTRITRGQLPLDLRSINLHTVLYEAIALVQPALDAKHLVLDLDFRADEPAVWGDGVRLRQVFWNVLKNAVKFTPGSGRITVRTHTDSGRGLVHVTVTDSGVGLTDEQQAHLFESLSRGTPADPATPLRSGSLALGLAVSRMLVELHSGHIRATSAGRGLGSAFTIDLPLRDTAVRSEGSGAPWPLRSAPLLAPPKPNPARRVRVLLVEDHAPTRHTLAQLLGRRHFDVLAAASVAEARAFGATDDFELVISDIGLPDGDGYELMAELRLRHPGLPGIAVTGYGMEDDFARSRLAGFAQHLIKPVNIATLEAAIAALLPPPPALVPQN